MHIWVDADACRGAIREILFRAAARTRHPLTLVANQILRTPASALVRMIQVAPGFDEADKYIADNVRAADLVITADIPLAADVVAKGAQALSPRGECYGKENIRELLDMRNFKDALRSSGVDTGGPPPFSAADCRRFANRLDHILSTDSRPPHRLQPRLIPPREG
ncbi:YaiI/YqxD family protein [Azoarcus sp. L1K30]|uniref:YaiI/YqxD family protein n=1 Tax=Azoarcus sp. L1K30 TaxID=2820277 RepID=UPI001B8371BD|nr:YaiI/YqxD family protein [Azoarcus sp. L1K30]MBR0566746.1 YaiI/YqxD family protein [Azoarcus sp. L1K30]